MELWCSCLIKTAILFGKSKRLLCSRCCDGGVVVQIEHLVHGNWRSEEHEFI